jgi:hypothetical protein
LDIDYENIPTQYNRPLASLTSIKRWWGALEYHPSGWEDILKSIKELALEIQDEENNRREESRAEDGAANIRSKI